MLKYCNLAIEFEYLWLKKPFVLCLTERKHLDGASVAGPLNEVDYLISSSNLVLSLHLMRLGPNLEDVALDWSCRDAVLVLHY